MVHMILDTVIMALDISEENLTLLTKTNSRVGALQQELRAAKAALASPCSELQSTSNRLAFLVPCYSETSLDQLEKALDGRSNKEWLVSVGLYFWYPSLVRVSSQFQDISIQLAQFDAICI